MTTIQEAFEIGIAHQQAGRLSEAAEIYRRIVAAEPGYEPAWYFLGTIAFDTGDAQAAANLFCRVVELKPDFAIAHNDLGRAYRDLGRFALAAASFRRAAELQPDFVEAHVHLGNVLNQVGKREEAIACYQRALQLKPDQAEVHGNLGVAYQGKGELDEAIVCYRRALELKADYADALSNLGTAYQEKGEIEKARACFHRAIELKPDFADAYRNLGTAHQQAGELEAAIACYRRALALKPRDAEAHDNLGSSLQGLGKLDEAFASHDRALALDPGLDSAHYNESLILLLRGEYRRGWEKYEFRWNTKERRGREFPRGKWEGEALAGRTILLHAEQGLGDTIQFIRYARLVKALDATVVVECPPRLVRLLKSCPGGDQVVSHGEELPPFDFHSPLLSLPRVFKTSLDTIPNRVPYLFAEPELVVEWRERLGALQKQRREPVGRDSGVLRIGVNWHGQARAGTWTNRNIPPKHFDRLAGLAGVS
jgi:tetratricopeptide (TPR) repeat protein